MSPKLPDTPMRYALLLALALPLAACGDVGDAPAAETAAVADGAEAVTQTGTALPLAADDSTVTWVGAKVTGSHEGGFTGVDGELYLDGETLTGADVRIDATTLWSDNDQLTEHLASDDFFAVGTYPEARFETDTLTPVAVADSVEWAEATHTVTGRLTMHGQTNEITFPALVEVTPEAASVRADFLIDRQKWGIVYAGKPDDLIRDDVRIRLQARAPRTAVGA